jgi:hypothetical protein
MVTTNPEFRAEVRAVLLDNATLPMVALGILELWSDDELADHEYASNGDAVEVAITIANESVGQPACSYMRV